MEAKTSATTAPIEGLAPSIPPKVKRSRFVALMVVAGCLCMAWAMHPYLSPPQGHGDRPKLINTRYPFHFVSETRNGDLISWSKDETTVRLAVLAIGAVSALGIVRFRRYLLKLAAKNPLAEISISERVLYWIAAWGGAAFVSAVPDPNVLLAAPYFPVGLGAYFTVFGLDGLDISWLLYFLIAGWLIYIGLTFLGLRQRLRVNFFVRYGILVVLLLLNVGGWRLAMRPPERTDIRYRAGGEIESPGSFTGITNDGRWFRVIDSQLMIKPSLSDPSETDLALPDGLLGPKSWLVNTSADGRRLIGVNDRGIAVWRSTPPHKLLHSWTLETDALAGPKPVTISQVSPSEIAAGLSTLPLRYLASPDGRFVCVHSIRQSPPGGILIRDLESGADVIHLAFPAGDAQVAWSGDSQLLAAAPLQAERYGEKSAATVWKVADWSIINRIDNRGDMHWLALSHDGALLFTIDGTKKGTSPNQLAVLRVTDGSVVASRNLPAVREAYLSPNDKYIFLPHESGLYGKPICLLDSATLDIIWLSSPAQSYKMVAFREDSSEVGAVGTNSGGLIGASVAKIWDTASGTVHLEAKTDYHGPRWFHFLSDGRAVAGTCLYEPVGRPR